MRETAVHSFPDSRFPFPVPGSRFPVPGSPFPVPGSPFMVLVTSQNWPSFRKSITKIILYKVADQWAFNSTILKVSHTRWKATLAFAIFIAHAKTLRVQSALPRSGSLLWLVYVFFRSDQQTSVGQEWLRDEHLRTSAGEAKLYPSLLVSLLWSSSSKEFGLMMSSNIITLL